MLYLRRRALLSIILSAIISAGLLSYLVPPLYEAQTVFFASAEPDTFTFYSPSEEIKRKPPLPLPDEEKLSVYIGLLESKGLIEMVGQKVNKDYDELRKHTDLKLNNEYLFELYVRDRNPETARNIANTYPEILDDFLERISGISTYQKRSDIEKEIEINRQKLSKAESDLQAFRLANREAPMSKDINRLTAEKFNLQMEIEKIQIKLRELDVKIDKIEEKLSEESKIYESSPSVYINDLIIDLKKQLSDLEASIASLRIDMRDTHPEVQKLKAQQKEKARDIEREINKIVGSKVKAPESLYEKMRKELTESLIEKHVLQARNAGFKDAIERLDRRILSLSDLESKVSELKSKSDLYRQTLNNLYLQMEETTAQGQRRMKNVFVVTPASIPEKPAFPKPILNILIAGLLGLVVGIFYCFFIDYVERTKDVERKWR